MQLNFSLKKAWTDLFSNKKYVVELALLMLLMIVLELVAAFSSLKLLPILGYLIWTGYVVLMYNNIINNREPVLEDVFANAKGRNIIASGLKLVGIGLVYGFGLGVFAGLATFILTKVLHFQGNIALLSVVLISLPLVVFMTLFGGLLFAENLKFSDGFNLKKGVGSFKNAWKEYLCAFGFLIIMYLLVCGAIVLIGLLFGTFVGLLIKSGIVIEKTVLHNCSMAFGSVLGNVFGFPLGYFFSHIIAQCYKYSLTKINVIAD